MDLGHGDYLNSSNQEPWFTDRAGDGGRGGSGGIIRYSRSCSIYAYNGDMVTNGNYDIDYYEYNKDGTINTNSKLKKVIRKDNKIIIPAKIFAQSGIIRETYTRNCGNFDFSKMETTLTKPSIATKWSEVVKVLATTEKSNNAVTGYTNPDGKCLANQGIGSGAGYLESSNGTFLPISE